MKSSQQSTNPPTPAPVPSGDEAARPGSGRWVRMAGWAALVGAMAGLVNLFLDVASSAATLGFWLPLEAWHVLAYLACGVALGSLLTPLWRLIFRGREGLEMPGLSLWLVFGIVAVMQVSALIERIRHVLVARFPWGVVLLGAFVVTLGFLAWVYVLRRLLGGGGLMSAATRWALALGALTSSAGLALNRNVIADVASKRALLADLAIVVAVAGIAWLLGRFEHRRLVVAGLLALVLGVGLTVAHRDVPEKNPSQASVEGGVDRPPPLILVVIDTLRRDIFEAVLEETAEGQRFREAIGGAAYFDRAVAAAPWTAPSVASIMTGLWPPEHGYGYREKMTRDLPLTRLGPSVRTLAEKLKARGYSTSAWVANPVLGAASGLDRGFERFELLNGATSKLPLLTVLERLGFFDQDLYLHAGAVGDRLESHLPSIAADSRPPFLWIHLMDPHLPFRRHPGLSPDPISQVTGDERLYRDEVRFAVDEVASMIGRLKHHGLFEDAVFVVVSDHGEMFPSDGHHTVPPANPKLYGHGHALYDELTHVPLIIRPPGGLGEVRRIDTLTSHVDLLPTFADLLGLDLRQPTVDRYSLAPRLGRAPVDGDAAIPERPFALVGANHIGKAQRGLHSGSHKLILHEDPRLETELFDLERDPEELSNLASTDRERSEEMGRLLDLAWGVLEKAEAGEPVELDAETREQLRALGYID